MPNQLKKSRTDVPDAFNLVAGRYDLLTALNPGYRKHLRWSARRLGLEAGSRVLDLCCGTGLSTNALAQEVPDAEIVGLDASAGMLAIAREKNFATEIQFVLGDAMEPEDAGIMGPFDGILMAYGIRNVEDPDVCLTRLYRLLRPGGTICFHEYSVADSIWITGVCLVAGSQQTSTPSTVIGVMRWAMATGQRRTSRFSDSRFHTPCIPPP